MSTANLPNTTALTEALTAPHRPAILNRIASWFRRVDRAEGGASESADRSEASEHDSSDNLPAFPAGSSALFGQSGFEPRGGLRKSWRRPTAVENVQQGLGALTELMTVIRDSLEKQSARQDELLGYLSHLPEALRQLPESNRLQGETLRAIHQQFERQTTQQAQVADILQRISQADTQQAATLDAMCGHNAVISENLGRVSEVMQTAGANSQAGAEVLEKMRDSMSTRDGELERLLKGQNTRLMTLLSVAVALSVVAVASVSVLGYLLMNRVH